MALNISATAKSAETTPAHSVIAPAQIPRPPVRAAAAELLTPEIEQQIVAGWQATARTLISTQDLRSMIDNPSARVTFDEVELRKDGLPEFLAKSSRDGIEFDRPTVQAAWTGVRELFPDMPLEKVRQLTELLTFPIYSHELQHSANGVRLSRIFGNEIGHGLLAEEERSARLREMLVSQEIRTSPTTSNEFRVALAELNQKKVQGAVGIIRSLEAIDTASSPADFPNTAWRFVPADMVRLSEGLEKMQPKVQAELDELAALGSESLGRIAKLRTSLEESEKRAASASAFPPETQASIQRLLEMQREVTASAQSNFEEVARQIAKSMESTRPLGTAEGFEKLRDYYAAQEQEMIALYQKIPLPPRPIGR